MICCVFFFLRQDLLLSWSVDGSLCIWDSYAEGQIVSPLSALLNGSDYPIYAVDIIERKAPSSNKGCILVAGGREAGFLGVPIYLHDF